MIMKTTAVVFCETRYLILYFVIIIFMWCLNTFIFDLMHDWNAIAGSFSGH